MQWCCCLSLEGQSGCITGDWVEAAQCCPEKAHCHKWASISATEHVTIMWQKKTIDSASSEQCMTPCKQSSSLLKPFLGFIAESGCILCGPTCIVSFQTSVGCFCTRGLVK